VPVESSLPPDIDVRHGEDCDEHEELSEPEPPEGIELHRERVQKDDLDVEQDEEDRGQVEADGEAALPARSAFGDAPIGVLMARAALLYGASRVLVTDPVPERLRLAEAQGAEARGGVGFIPAGRISSVLYIVIVGQKPKRRSLE